MVRYGHGHAHGHKILSYYPVYPGYPKYPVKSCNGLRINSILITFDFLWPLHEIFIEYKLHNNRNLSFLMPFWYCSPF